MRHSRELSSDSTRYISKTSKIFFTADQHYGHARIIDYCNRPFGSVEEMDAALIKRHNSVVNKSDLVVHIGDFSLLPSRKTVTERYVRKLKGKHIFLIGDHDKWLNKNKYAHFYTIQDPRFIYVCLHWPMRTWPMQRYGTYHFHGHSHGRLPGIGKSIDVGVDNWNYYPASAKEIRKRIIKEHGRYNFRVYEQNIEALSRGALVDQDA